jgi:catechol 2,3-dioxygenase-like lactoylglutathione lyase family enzyme
MAGIGRLQSVVLDCPDARALAGFYRDLLGWKVEYDEPGVWVTLSDGGPVKLCLQQVAEHRPPRWPDPADPQQFHLDLEVDDLAAAEQEALALGAVTAEVQPARSYRVMLDPAGHPFCLCT